MKITDNLKVWIEMDGYEPVLNVWKRKGPRYTHHSRMGAFYPFRVLTKKLYDIKIKQYFNKMKYELIPCQGCGEGISEWVILDPNMTGEKLYVCHHCVSFYDALHSKKRLELQWQLEAEQMNK